MLAWSGAVSLSAATQTNPYRVAAIEKIKRLDDLLQNPRMPHTRKARAQAQRKAPFETDVSIKATSRAQKRAVVKTRARALEREQF